MEKLDRRGFLKILGKGAIALAAPALISGCQSLKPKPFIAGDEAQIPTGCKILRQTNPNGDC